MSGDLVWNAPLGGRPRLYHFDTLAIGERMEIPYRDNKHRTSIYMALRVFKGRYGGTFVWGHFDGHALIKRLT